MNRLNVDNKIIKVIVSSDVHGAIFPYDFIAGSALSFSLSQFCNYVRVERERPGQFVVLLDNGDILQGQPTVYYYNFEDHGDMHLCARVMNYMRYDAATIGNHDIESGHSVYDAIRPLFDFPWLGANIIDEATGKSYFEPYTVIERGGVRIAVLGLCTPGIPNWLPPAIWEGMRFDDMIEAASFWVKHIRETERPDIVIGLFHSGIDYNYNQQSADTYRNENATLLIARRVAGFDVVFGGHDHHEYLSWVENPHGKAVLVVNPKCYARFAGVATFTLRDTEQGMTITRLKGDLIPVSGYTPESLFVKIFEPERRIIEAYIAKQIGHFTSSVSSRDSLFGNAAFVDMVHRVQLEISGADISFASPLTFDTTVERGDVYIRDMFKLYKYENLLYVMRLSGHEIRAYLEFSYNYWFNTMSSENDHLLNFDHDMEGKLRMVRSYYNFSSAAGIDYEVDVSQPVGQKVRIHGFSDGRPFETDALYSVALNSYRGNGGGGHLTLGAGIPVELLPDRIVRSSDNDLRYYLMKWIEKQQVVTPKALGNWKIVPENYYNKGRKRDYHLLFESGRIREDKP